MGLGGVSNSDRLVRRGNLTGAGTSSNWEDAWVGWRGAGGGGGGKQEERAWVWCCCNINVFITICQQS